ncbi:DUF7522 family protein [Halobacterium zhouii]|uniref:DUF7522 family protein n=1 Tax=Halobacterium zhouii TaxID=2902624 RepID=UPI001E2AFC89|nr:hypothetical protein [Halobacterium zhouii]
MPRTDDELVDALQEHVGDKLRVVGRHDADSWAVSFMRDDVQANYRSDEVDEIAGDLALSEMGATRQEDLYELGSLRATVRLFEDGFVVHVSTGERSGRLISIDDDATVMGRDVVQIVRRVVE